ncbi:Fusaric acid resistance protein-like [Thioclava dalianensis]|nr:FUSC family protein [Thioclava dalianensis]SFN03766.1 Fusaric acid resistance protein-like [Thioclava dalianensis]
MIDLLRRVADLNWPRALPAVVALSGLLMGVLWLDLPRAQELAALGVGFATSTGQGKGFRDRRWPITLMDIAGKMLGIAAGMAAAQFHVGGVALTVPGMLIGAFVVGALSRRDMSLWWVLLQSWLFFSLAGFLVHYVDSPAVVLVTVALAMIWVIAIEEGLRVAWGWLGPDHRAPLDGQAPPEGAAPLDAVIGQGLQAILAVGMSYGIALILAINHPYWAPLSALLMLGPRPGLTWERVALRTGATVAGAVGASVLVLVLGPANPVLPVFYVLFGMISILFIGRHFPSFVAFLTALIVVMVTMGNAEPVVNAWGRIVGTLLGGGAALVVSYLAHRIREALGMGSSLPS